MAAPTAPVREVVEAFLDDLFRHQPVLATAMGDHRFDDRWPDVSDEGIAAYLAMLRSWRERVGTLDAGPLTGDDAVDRDLLAEEIDALLFDTTELAPHRWDPLAAVYLAGSGLFPIVAREFAPLEDRMTALAGRVERLPALLEAAAANLTGLPDRPVSLLHLENAMARADGITDLVDQALDDGRRSPDAAGGGRLAAALSRIEAARPAARAAVDGYRRRLDRDIRPRADGEGRLGRDLFTRTLRWALRSDLSPPDLLARAQREYALVRGEMLRVAREMWPAWLPGREMPDASQAGSVEAAEDETIRLALDAVAARHPRVDEILDRCRDEATRLAAWVTERGLVEVPDEPLEVIWTPRYLRSLGGGYLDAPGPLEGGQKSFFGFTPPPEDASPERIESFLREENDRMLSVLTIHETIPGHYLQLWWANRHGSLVRAVFGSSVFAEGWAVYVTQVMMDLGYGGDDLGLWLTHWKFYLRAVVNAILDVRVHGGAGEPMGEGEALRLMVEGGFQEEHEARAKWDRARLTATQLSTYFVGSVEMWDLEREARRRAAEAAGHEGPMPQPRVVGGLGETPRFSYPEHLRAVLSHGSPPIHALRRILFDSGGPSGSRR